MTVYFYKHQSRSFLIAPLHTTNQRIANTLVAVGLSQNLSIIFVSVSLFIVGSPFGGRLTIHHGLCNILALVSITF